MKRYLFLLLFVLFFIPSHVFAMTFEYDNKSYAALNLDEILEENNIEKEYDHYEEKDDQVPIYLFYGDGCTYCENFIKYLNSITNEYGEYFKLVAFNVWDDEDIVSLHKSVADFIGSEESGIPLIIIDGAFYNGYDSSYDDSIKEAIKTAYDSSKKNDVFESMLKKGVSPSSKDKEHDSSDSSDSSNIILSFLFTVISTIIIIVYIHVRFNRFEEKYLKK